MLNSSSIWSLKEQRNEDDRIDMNENKRPEAVFMNW